MLDRIKSMMGGATAPTAEVMSFGGEEPCEDCGATPADDLVGVRWLCRSCSPDARRAEREADGQAATGSPAGGGPSET